MTHSHEPSQTDPVDMLVTANIAAAEAVGKDGEGFNDSAADFILRNMAVISDRLAPHEFQVLSKEAHDSIAAMAFMANDISPQTEENMARRPHETDEEHQYRTLVWQPIHSLQRKVITHDYDTTDEHMLSKLRFATQAAGLAFATVLQETKNLPEIHRTIGYFQGNTSAAVRFAQRSVRNEQPDTHEEEQ